MKAGRTWIWSYALLLLSMSAPLAIAQESSDAFYEAIRSNDIKALRAHLKMAGVNFSDKHGSTPLMYAAALGNIDAMRVLLGAGADVNAKNALDATALMWCMNQPDMARVLIDKGADVNARSKMGRTPLLIAASYEGNVEVIKRLLAKGAKILTRDNLGNTPLLAATAANDLASVELLLNHGADFNGMDVHSKEMAGLVPITPAMGGLTPLMNAAAWGNADIVRMLLARGADVNSVSTANPPILKNGSGGLASFTALTLGAAYGGADTIKVLLDHGAKVNASDTRGLTPLMLSISTDRSDPRAVRLLLAKGADPGMKSGSGETAIDWSRKFQNASVMEALDLKLNETTDHPVVVPAGKITDLKKAVSKSISLLQRVNSNFMTTGGCVACHGQNLTAMAVQAARSNGLQVDEALAANQANEVNVSWVAFEQPLLQHIDTPGGADDLEYSLFQMAADGIAANRTIDAMISNLAGRQQKNGRWHNVPFGNRAPMEDGDVSRTAMAVRCLRIYASPSRKAKYDRQIERAAAWLRATSPITTEERNMQLLGLLWAGKDVKQLQTRLDQLLGLQRADGGWSQTPGLVSDAYATGQVLFTLHAMGVSSSDGAYQRGVEHLLRTEFDDGSWHVVSRAVKFQPYFQSGFPHGHDQWISAAGTAWAAIGLSYAVGNHAQPVVHLDANLRWQPGFRGRERPHR